MSGCLGPPAGSESVRLVTLVAFTAADTKTMPQAQQDILSNEVSLFLQRPLALFRNWIQPVVLEALDLGKWR